MTAAPVRVVIVDFDGVILESNGLKTEGFARVFADFPQHADAMMAFHHANVSMSRYDKFQHLVTQRLGRPADDPLVADLAGRFSAVMMRLIEECPLVPGALEFLAEVSSRVPLFVSSMTPHAELVAILERRGLASSFTGIYGYPPWPKRDVIANVLAERSVPAGEALFVGDSAGDQRVARDAGVEFLARNSGLPFDDPQPRTFPDMSAVLAAVRPRLFRGSSTERGSL